MKRELVESINGNRRRSNNRRKQIVATQKLIISTCVIAVLFSALFLFNPFTSQAKESDEQTLYKYYNSIIVNYNDSLSTIASRYCNLDATDYESYIEEVCEINHLQDPDDLVAGNNIVVPYYSYEFQ